MINNAATLALFVEGARIPSLATAFQIEMEEVEDALRAALRTMMEEYQPSVSAEPAPLTTARKAKAADSSPSPLPRNCAAAMKRSPARRAVAKAVGEFADYPEALRDRRADRMRVVFDLLRHGPATVSELEARLDTSAGEFDGDVTKWLCNGLYTLHAKGIVIKPDAPGGKWRLA